MELERKTCGHCKIPKSVGEFYKSSRTRDGYRNWCKLCQKHDGEKYRVVKVVEIRTKKEVYRKKNKIRKNDLERARRSRMSPEQKLEGRLRSMYGITIDDYNALRVFQNDKCAICRRPPTTKRTKSFFVDHDHNTGKVRGLLCFACNWGLGYLESDKFLFAKEYLNNPPVQQLGIQQFRPARPIHPLANENIENVV